jgi:hypothetical protein
MGLSFGVIINSSSAPQYARYSAEHSAASLTHSSHRGLAYLKSATPQSASIRPRRKIIEFAEGVRIRFRRERRATFER